MRARSEAWTLARVCRWSLWFAGSQPWYLASGRALGGSASSPPLRRRCGTRVSASENVVASLVGSAMKQAQAIFPGCPGAAGCRTEGLAQERAQRGKGRTEESLA